MEQLLLGEVGYKMGQKHRLAIPKKFRDILGPDLIMSRGYEGCLIIVNYDRWTDITASINQASFLDSNGRASARFLLGGATQLEVDAQGRCIVPANLYQHAGFEDEVVFVGLGRWLEVWAADRWQQQQAQLQDLGPTLAQGLITSNSVK